MRDSPYLIGGVTWSFFGLPLHELAALATIIYALVRTIAWLPEAGKSIRLFYRKGKLKLKTLFGKQQ